ncbi:MAG: sigma-70 family RNA polymerase sigma factor [Bacteroidota bacterium]
MTKLTEKTLDDRLLIAKAKRGDERAFTALVNRYEGLLYSFSLKICRDKEKAEETLQDTFVNVFRNLKQFDAKSKFTTWLYRIATNNCLMKRRRRKMREVTVSIEEPVAFHEGEEREPTRTQVQTIPSWKDSPLQRVMNVELRHLLDKAIQRLPLDHRVVFVLRDVEGASAEETAKILKLTVPAVKSRLRRARVFLREQLNEYMTS